MYKFCNLPKKGGAEIEGLDRGNHYRIQTDEGWLICEVEKNHDAQIAGDIADAIRFARDEGYQQALADIRRQLGIDT
jgi:hypothetical protein